MGFRGKYQNKRDANEPEIVATLRAHGLSVVSLDTPCDLLVGYAGRTYLAEVKSAKGKLTKTQADFVASWRGQFDILRSVQDADDFARKVKHGLPPIALDPDG